MKNEEQIGYQIKELGRLLDKNILQKASLNIDDDSVTAMHGWMLGYLYHRKDDEVFQKDMEADFHMAKSSVTAALQSLEKAGYVRRTSVERDARLKKIELTEKGLGFHCRIERAINEMEESLMVDFSQEQKKELFTLFGQLRNRLETVIAEDGERLERRKRDGHS